MSDAESGWWQTETNDEVATKPELWRPLSDAINGFDLDPAAGCEPSPIATDRYTKEDDGLAQSWYGDVWLNPPFATKKDWYRKLVDEYWNGDVEVAIALAPADTSADWFHDWFVTANLICFMNGRDWYLAGNSPSFQTMVGLWNPNSDCVTILESMGTIVKPRSNDKNRTLGENYE